MLRKAIITTILFMPLVVNADFLVEIDGNLATGEGSYESDDYYIDDFDYDIDTSSLSAKIYFGKVGASNSPYREAGFLSKNSSVKITRDTYEYDLTLSNTKLITTALKGRFVIPNANIILGAGLIKGKAKSKDDDPYFPENETNDIAGFTLLGGVYINDNSAISLSYENSDTEYEGYDDTKTKTIHLNFKQVHSLGTSNHLAWHLDATKREDGEDFDQIFIGGGIKFYIQQKFGVGVSLEIGKDDYGYDDGVRALFTPEISYDFTENIGIYAQIDSEAIIYDNDEDETLTTRTIQFGLTGRF